MTVLGPPVVSPLISCVSFPPPMADLYCQSDPSHERDFPLSPRLRFSHSAERPPMLSQLGQDRAHMRVDFHGDHLPYLESATTSTPPALVVSTDSRDQPSHLTLPGNFQNAGQSPAQTRRSRKDKTHIELSADQPPTTQGRPRTRVFVACVQWCAVST